MKKLMTISKLINNHIEKQGFNTRSKRQVYYKLMAEAVGVNKHTVYTWVTGTFIPQQRYHKKISGWLTCSHRKVINIWKSQLSARRRAKEPQFSLDDLPMPTPETSVTKIKPVSNLKEFDHVISLASEVSKLNYKEQELFNNLLSFLERNYK